MNNGEKKGMESVDLIFKDSINWSALLTSVNHLLESDKTLSVQSIRQDNGILIIGITTSVAKEEIESSFWTLYQSIMDEKQNQIKLLQAELKSHQEQNNHLLQIIEVMAEKENNPTLQGSHFTGGFVARDFTCNIITYNQGNNHGDITHNEGDVQYKEAIKELQTFLDRLSGS